MTVKLKVGKIQLRRLVSVLWAMFMMLTSYTVCRLCLVDLSSVKNCVDEHYKYNIIDYLIQTTICILTTENYLRFFDSFFNKIKRENT